MESYLANIIFFILNFCPSLNNNVIFVNCSVVDRLKFQVENLFAPFFSCIKFQGCLREIDFAPSSSFKRSFSHPPFLYKKLIQLENQSGYKRGIFFVIQITQKKEFNYFNEAIQNLHQFQKQNEDLQFIHKRKMIQQKVCTRKKNMKKGKKGQMEKKEKQLAKDQSFSTPLKKNQKVTSKKVQEQQAYETEPQNQKTLIIKKKEITQQEPKTVKKARLQKKTNSKKKIQNRLNTISSKKKLKNDLYLSPCEKLTLSLILFFLWTFLFQDTNAIVNPIQVIDDQVKNTFQITTLKKIQTIRFTVAQSELISDYIPLNSTKLAKVQAKIQVQVGFDLEKVEKAVLEDGTEHYNADFSSLKVLSYSVEDVQYLEKVDGYFNAWEIEDHKYIVKYIEKNYLENITGSIIQKIQERERRLLQFSFASLLQGHSSFISYMMKINSDINRAIESYFPKNDTNLQKKVQEFTDIIEFAPPSNEEQMNESLYSTYEWILNSFTNQTEESPAE